MDASYALVYPFFLRMADLIFSLFSTTIDNTISNQDLYSPGTLIFNYAPFVPPSPYSQRPSKNVLAGLKDEQNRTKMKIAMQTIIKINCKSESRKTLFLQDIAYRLVLSN